MSQSERVAVSNQEEGFEVPSDRIANCDLVIFETFWMHWNRGPWKSEVPYPGSSAPLYSGAIRWDRVVERGPSRI